MNETERKAQEYLHKGEWVKAIEFYDQLILTYQNNRNIGSVLPKEKLVSYFIGKSECNLALGRNDFVVQDCRRVLKLYLDHDLKGTQRDKARRLLVQSLIQNKRFSEADAAIKEWLLKGKLQTDTRKILEQLRSRFQNGHRGYNILTQKLEEDLVALEASLNSWIIAERPKKNGNYEVEVKSENMNGSDVKKNMAKMNSPQAAASSGASADDLNCSYCSLQFPDVAALRSHCLTGSHQTVIMSDEGRDWKFRPPPRGLTADAYALCENFHEKNGTCRYGAQCVDAHGPEELAEWRERFEYRRMKLQRACEKQLYGKSYTEQLLERWVNSSSPETVMKDKIEGVEESISGDLATTVSSKNSQREWTFLLKSNRRLKAVALLQDAHRNHFALKQVATGDALKIMSSSEWKPTNDQEWTLAGDGGDLDVQTHGILEHRVRVGFKTEIYGTFRQSVVFDFDTEPVLVKHLCVDVVPVTDADKMKEIRKELVLSTSERWGGENSEIVSFQSAMLGINAPSATSVLETEKEERLMESYPTPRSSTFQLTHSTVTDKKLTRNNYRDRMHELLYVEEMARYEQVARYNLTAKLHVANCYLLAPNGMANSTAKYAHNGELFALMSLGKDVSEDTSAGRLILNNCSTVFLSAAKNANKAGKSQGQAEESKNGKRVVYEALIEDKGKTVIYLRLSATTVSALKLKPDCDFYCEVQFQLNRIPYCEWHFAIDKIADFKIIFPDTYLEPSIPWTPQRQWNDMIDSRLNLKQREAVVAITTPVASPLPPILIIGPFGTGKTYTLAQAIKQLLTQPDTKILVCTHSNSAADLYIKDYLHPYVEAGHEEARPLRIYYHKRWVATVNSIVQKYCLIEMAGGVRTFKIPTLEDILKHRIVVVTLSISMYLSTLGLKKGHFSHILLDEAAQAMECEAIMPLALANDHTRIVLAGDHMQLSPELFSHFAKERDLHVSLLERLYDHYPASFPCKILLCENYRAHEAIINFTSELFYEQKLISSGKQPRHDKFFPLSFFTTRGEDVQDVNSTAFYNNSEVYEVVERVCELKKKWPSSWGKIDDQSIGIMTPYADQVFRIRSELRKRRMGGISVERVLNVQGKQFRAIFLSTVRTRRTCLPGTKQGDGNSVEMDYGFLSNSKLLNTAITRAQSLVAVVGDPVALCSIGRCRKVWERFIEICNENKSLFGITWTLLRSQLDGVELKKTYTLNPLAPEFVPRALQNESYIKLPSLLGNYGPGILPPRFTGPPPFIPGPPVPYPVYYYPAHGQAGPMFPVRPPNVPYHIGGAWPGGFPAPAGAAPSPTQPGHPGWNQNMKKKPEVRKEDVKMPGLVPERRSPVLSEVKPILPVMETNQPSPNMAMDNFLVANLRPNPNTIPQHHGIPANLTEQQLQQLQQQQQQQHPPIQHLQPVLRPIQLEKQDQIQFLNNVHFPERQLPRPQLSADWQVLLPPNATLAQVLESRSLQVDWYRHLLSTAGIDAANCFKELVVRHSHKHVTPPPEVTLRMPLDELFSEKHYPVPNGYPGKHPVPHMGLNEGLDNEVVPGKALLLQDIEAAMLLSASNLHPPLPIEPQPTHVPTHVPAHALPSIPLYRRQPSQPAELLALNQRGLLLNDEVSVEQLLNNFNMLQLNSKLWEVDKMPLDMKAMQMNSVEMEAMAKGAAVPRELLRPPPPRPIPPPMDMPFLSEMNDFHLNGREQDIDESASSRQNIETTYASVLRAQPMKTAHSDEEKAAMGDPFGILKGLAHSSSHRSSNGLYQYFS